MCACSLPFFYTSIPSHSSSKRFFDFHASEVIHRALLRSEHIAIFLHFVQPLRSARLTARSSRCTCSHRLAPVHVLQACYPPMLSMLALSRASLISRPRAQSMPRESALSPPCKSLRPQCLATARALHTLRRHTMLTPCARACPQRPRDRRSFRSRKVKIVHCESYDQTALIATLPSARSRSSASELGRDFLNSIRTLGTVRLLFAVITERMPSL